jgi:hypothetical protein
MSAVRLGIPSATAASNLPALIAGAGDRATLRFLEFFTVNIRNRNNRAARVVATLLDEAVHLPSIPAPVAKNMVEPFAPLRGLKCRVRARRDDRGRNLQRHRPLPSARSGAHCKADLIAMQRSWLAGRIVLAP